MAIDGLYSVADMARMLDMRYETMHRLVKTGAYPSPKVACVEGGRLYYTREEVSAFLATEISEMSTRLRRLERHLRRCMESD